MAAIAMCRGDNCPLKNTCYRYLAVPDEFWQAIFVGVPYKNNKCEEYWEVIRRGDKSWIEVNVKNA